VTLARFSIFLKGRRNYCTLMQLEQIEVTLYVTTRHIYFVAII